MSIVTVYSVFCNGHECARWIGEERTIRTARVAARAAGWVQRSTSDYCPKCQSTYAGKLPTDRDDQAPKRKGAKP